MTYRLPIERARNIVSTHPEMKDQIDHVILAIIAAEEIWQLLAVSLNRTIS